MKVADIEFGSGNLKSVYRSLEKASYDKNNIRIIVTNKSKIIESADRIILPGVGSFTDCKEGLELISNLIDTLNESVLVRERPFLGICVGMQLMATYGTENKKVKGLDWIPGKVIAINPNPRHQSNGQKIKIPHMGWNKILFDKTHPVLKGLTKESYFYFVHSYHFKCDSQDAVLAEVNYNEKFAALVGINNFLGTQFHPEKSQTLGIKFLSNFLKWDP